MVYTSDFNILLQVNTLEDDFISWKGSSSQTDDATILLFRN